MTLFRSRHFLCCYLVPVTGTKEKKRKTLLSNPDWKILLKVHNDASDKKFGAVINQNNKPIASLSIKLTKPQSNYTTTEKELLKIVKCLKQFCGILFCYEIEESSYHKNLAYAATLSEFQRVMRWRLILEDFGNNI